MPFNLLDENTFNEYNNILEFFSSSELLVEDNIDQQLAFLQQRAKEKVSHMRKPSEAQIEQLRLKELQKTKQLQQNIISNINTTKNIQNCANIASDPNQFMIDNKNTMQNMPQNIRRDLMRPPSNPQDKKTLLTYFGMFWRKLTFTSMILYTISSMSHIGESVMTTDQQIKLKDGTFANVAIRIPFNLTSIIYGGIIKLFNKITGGMFNADSLLKTAEYSFGGKSYTFKQPTFSTSLYITAAVMLIPMLYSIYKNIKKSNEIKKRQEYAMSHKMMQEDVTIEMLIAESEENKKYFEEIELLDENCNELELEILDEGLIDWIKKFLPTPTNLLRLINKGLIKLVQISRALEEALKTESISPFIASIYNIILSLANITLNIAKAALTMIGGFVGTNTQKIEKEYAEEKQMN